MAPINLNPKFYHRQQGSLHTLLNYHLLLKLWDLFDTHGYENKPLPRLVSPYLVFRLKCSVLRAFELNQEVLI